MDVHVTRLRGQRITSEEAVAATTTTTDRRRDDVKYINNLEILYVVAEKNPFFFPALHKQCKLERFQTATTIALTLKAKSNFFVEQRQQLPRK